jgi:hypothetical protein
MMAWGQELIVKGWVDMGPQGIFTEKAYPALA